MEFHPLPGKTFGAYVTGKQITDFHDADWLAIHRAFLRYGVLIFPGQFVTATTQEVFAKQFGNIEQLAINFPQLKAVPIGNVSGKKLIKSILTGGTHAELAANAERIPETDAAAMQGVTQNEAWHIDSTYMPRCAKAGTLNAVEVPGDGGGTSFADAAAAYDDLDDGLRQRINTLQAYHSQHYSFMYKQARELKVGEAYGYNGDAHLHNVVKIHPETGRKSIYLGRHAFRIKGWERDAARKLIQQLNDHVIADTSRVYFHSWSPGDLAIWDNRRMYHKAGEFDLKQKRLLLGIRITGDQSESCLTDPDSKTILEEELSVLRQERGLPPRAKL